MSAKHPLLVFVCLSPLLGTACTESQSPVAPSRTGVEPPVPTTPSPPKGIVEMSVVPNPVPFRGQPITDVAACANLKNTWFYEQVLKEVGGAAVTFTARVDAFDGSPVNSTSGLSLVVPANGLLTFQSRWCSVSAVEHTTQTTLTGTDASGNMVTATAGVIRLLKP